MLVSDYLGILWLIEVETKLSETLLKYLRSVELFVTNFYRTISNFYFSNPKDLLTFIMMQWQKKGRISSYSMSPHESKKREDSYLIL